jgi:alcohol dehydrogenase (cytochrome c)
MAYVRTLVRSSSPSAHKPAILCLLFLSGFAGKSAAQGVYTTAEAERGAVAYDNLCVSCHPLGPNGDRPLFAPALAPNRIVAWGRDGWTVDDLFYVIRANMPPGAARSLSNRQRLDIVAFILQQNGLPAGDIPLREEAAYLRDIALSRGDGALDEAPAPPLYITGDRGTRPTTSSPTPAELLAAGDNDEDWLYHTGDYSGRRYSGLSQVNRETVQGLSETCRYTMTERGSHQTGPLVYDGTMYVTSARETIALDAATCEERWKHVWNPPGGGFGGTNRGIALASGRLVRGTSDGYMLAIDAETGDLLWARKAADTDVGETFTMAPLIWEDRILMGPAISENAIEGWAAAFSLSDGEELWRFNIVPKEGEPGYETWDHSNNFPVGGGGVWTPMSVDVETGTLFLAATNPAPDFPAAMRGGDNLYTNSALALDMRTGRLLWHDQMVPADDHDWDLTQVSPVFTGTVDGRERNLLGTVGKDGVFRLLDRDSRERLWETPVTTIANAEAPVTSAGTYACPGVLGGVEWNGPAYNPSSNMLYTPAVDWCGTFFAADTVRFIPGTIYFGGTYMADAMSQGWLTAIDVESGDVAWQYQSPRPMVGAVTTTGGGLVFAGELTGDLLAFDSDTGEELARIPTGGPIGGGLVTYSVDGQQYVAVASGNPSGFWVEDDPGTPSIVVLTLDEGP